MRKLDPRGQVSWRWSVGSHAVRRSAAVRRCSSSLARLDRLRVGRPHPQRRLGAAGGSFLVLAALGARVALAAALAPLTRSARSRCWTIVVVGDPDADDPRARPPGRLQGGPHRARRRLSRRWPSGPSVTSSASVRHRQPPPAFRNSPTADSTTLKPHASSWRPTRAGTTGITMFVPTTTEFAQNGQRLVVLEPQRLGHERFDDRAPVVVPACRRARCARRSSSGQNVRSTWYSRSSTSSTVRTGAPSMRDSTVPADASERVR